MQMRVPEDHPNSLTIQRTQATAKRKKKCDDHHPLQGISRRFGDVAEKKNDGKCKIKNKI